MTHASHASMIRPAWTPATIAMMVIGFMLFWPLGLAMLAYILWGDRLDDFKSDINRATDNMRSSFKCRGRGFSSHRAHHMHRARTGNVAFDEWREVEMARLEEERRKLDAMRSEFDEYLRELRRAKDAEEFDRFMASKKSNGNSSDDKPSGGKSVPNT
jgi:hypothetical protein